MVTGIARQDTPARSHAKAAPASGADMLRQVTVILAVLATVVVNYLATALPLAGRTTGDLAARFPVEIQPASYAFSIWGLIYLGLAGFTVYQALPAQRASPRLRRIGWLVVGTCVANIAWIFLWHYQQVALSLVAMLALLSLLAAIYLRARRDERPSPAERLLVLAPFSLYAGWITAASLVNTAVIVYDLDAAFWRANAVAFTIGLLAVAALAGAVVGLTRADPPYAAVLVWASVGVVVANRDQAVLVAAAAAVAVVAVVSLALGFMRRAARPDRAAAGASGDGRGPSTMC
ncbi:MAG: tryptophan-rich sensory protein [Dehalococcoidia bacterium]